VLAELGLIRKRNRKVGRRKKVKGKGDKRQRGPYASPIKRELARREGGGPPESYKAVSGGGTEIVTKKGEWAKKKDVIL